MTSSPMPSWSSGSRSMLNPETCRDLLRTPRIDKGFPGFVEGLFCLHMGSSEGSFFGELLFRGPWFNLNLELSFGFGI